VPSLGDTARPSTLYRRHRSDPSLTYKLYRINATANTAWMESFIGGTSGATQEL
jgi:hypothetical protein